MTNLDDGLKDNILYVSADQKDDKPEGAVYAAVNKKESESNNNSNIYAEVNKSDLKDGGNKKKGKSDRYSWNISNLYLKSTPLLILRVPFDLDFWPLTSKNLCVTICSLFPFFCTRIEFLYDLDPQYLNLKSNISFLKYM